MIKPKPPGSERLKSFADRIDRLEEERRAIVADVKDVYTEVDKAGYSPKALRKVLAERRRKTDEQFEAELETYRVALGMGTYRAVAEQFGVSKSKLQRLVPRKEKGTPHHDPETGEISQPSQAAANGGGDHDGGLLKQPMAEVAGVAPPTMPSSAPVAASGTRFAEADIGEPAGYKVNNDGLLAHDSDPEPATHSERPALQEVGASDPRPEGTPTRAENAHVGIDLTAEAERLGLTAIVRDLQVIQDDLTIPAHLDQRKRQAHA